MVSPLQPARQPTVRVMDENKAKALVGGGTDNTTVNGPGDGQADANKNNNDSKNDKDLLLPISCTDP